MTNTTLNNEKLQELIKMESFHINENFERSETMAIFYFKSAVDSYIDFLSTNNPTFVPAFSLEYRKFITELLSCVNPNFLPITIKYLISGKV
jgi:hypothetical protein